MNSIHKYVFFNFNDSKDLIYTIAYIFHYQKLSHTISDRPMSQKSRTSQPCLKNDHTQQTKVKKATFDVVLLCERADVP